jgi:glycopeptide antibiotics resistance protein
MRRVGRYTVYAGAILVAFGLIGGFTALFRDDDSLAVNLLTLVPLGFVLLLAGTVVSQLSGTSDSQ